MVGIYGDMGVWFPENSGNFPMHLSDDLLLKKTVVFAATHFHKANKNAHCRVRGIEELK